MLRGELMSVTVKCIQKFDGLMDGQIERGVTKNIYVYGKIVTVVGVWTFRFFQFFVLENFHNKMLGGKELR